MHSTKWVRLAEEMNGIYQRSVNTMPSRDLLFAADTHVRVYRANRSPAYLARAKGIVDTLIDRADRAMYRSKQDGRNRVSCAV